MILLLIILYCCLNVLSVGQKSLPESFEECFMYKEGYNVTPDTVLKVIVFHASTPEQHNIVELVKQFLRDCNENG